MGTCTTVYMSTASSRSTMTNRWRNVQTSGACPTNLIVALADEHKNSLRSEILSETSPIALGGLLEARWGIETVSYSRNDIGVETVRHFKLWIDLDGNSCTFAP